MTRDFNMGSQAPISSLVNPGKQALTLRKHFLMANCENYGNKMLLI